MLLNLSNHPSTDWNKQQLDAARQQFGAVADLPFPQVDPSLDEKALDQLVQQYYDTVRERKPQAVHIMGELTFCVAIIGKLCRAGIPCLASTTHRHTETLTDGRKIVKFEFVQFRQYQP